MGNPYYIPRPENPLGGLTRNIMALAEMKQRSDIARMGLEQDQARLAADQEYRTQTLAQGEEQNRLAREKHLAERPDLRPYDAKTHVKARMAVRQLGLEGSGIENFLESAQENGYTSGQLYSGLRTPQMQKQLKKHIEDQIIKNSDAPGFIGSPQEEQLNDLLEALDGENYNAFVDGLFPEVAQYNATLANEAKKNAKEPLSIYDEKKKVWRWYDYQTRQEIPELVGQVPEKFQTGAAANQSRIDAANISASGRITAANIGAAAKGGKTTKSEWSQKDLMNLEAQIMSYDTKPGWGAKVRVFNEHAQTPYFYDIKTDDDGIQYPEKRSLGTIGSHQITPKDITDTWNYLRQNGKNISWWDTYLAILKKAKEGK